MYKDKMFRLQDNVPEVYMDESRDFQTLAHLYDLVFGATKYGIDSIRHTANTLEMNSALLDHLRYKLGFFTTKVFGEDELRYILMAFPFLIRKKGTKSAIEQAANMWLRVNRDYEAKQPHVDPIVNRKNTNVSDEYTVDINLNTNPRDLSLLEEMMTYLLPAGYKMKYKFVYQDDTKIGDVILYNKNEIAIDLIDINTNSKLPTDDDRKDNDPAVEDLEDKDMQTLYHKVGFTRVYQADETTNQPEGE